MADAFQSVPVKKLSKVRVEVVRPGGEIGSPDRQRNHQRGCPGVPEANQTDAAGGNEMKTTKTRIQKLIRRRAELKRECTTAKRRLRLLATRSARSRR